MIVCRTLGPIDLTVDGAAPPPELLWRKNLALLVYLARSPKRARTRDHLVGLLWPDKDESAARHSLREAIRVLRRSIGEAGLTTEGDQVRLADDAVELDVDLLDAALRQQQSREAAALVSGEFMEGFGIADSSAFEDWLGAERLTWRRQGVAALTEHATELTDRGQLREALAVARRALRLDDTADAPIRVVMRALALDGDRAGALEAFDDFTARLRAVGREPDAASTELAERVRRERTWRLSADVPVHAEGGAEMRRAPLIGREHEMEQLVGAWHQCRRQPAATACAVLGDAGTGKTRLLDELRARGRLGGAATASVRAVEADRAVSYSGLWGLAREGLLDATGLPAASPAALGTFAAELPEWADRFGAPKGTRAALGAAWTEVLQAITLEQPVALLVDDAQWLDAETVGALVAALRDLHDRPFFIVLALTTELAGAELDAWRARIGRDIPGVTVRLGPLNREALQSLAAWALPDYAAAAIERLVRRLAVDSAGLPLLAIEILHAVASGLDLGTVEGAWPEPSKTLDQTLPGELPDAIVASIRVGFRRLSADAQLVAGTAAALGDRTDGARLATITDLAGDRLHAALDELEWQRWLVAEPRGYAFIARVVGEIVARDMLTEGQRRRIQEAAGR